MNTSCIDPDPDPDIFLMHMTNPKIFIVILQYNNSQDTIRCLNSVKELDYSKSSVIIVDNGSDVNHVNTIKHFLENHETINYKLETRNSNLGYSGGNNIGIKHALEHGADYIFILNPDTIVEKDLLVKLVGAGETDAQLGILGPAIDEDDKIIYGGKIKWLKPELYHLETRNQKLETSFYIPGAAMLIKREVIDKIGLLDERYFLYFEDADYCVRATKAGYRLQVVPKSLIYHRPSSSTGTLGAPLLLHYHYRNAHLFNWNNGPWQVKFALPFWSIFIIIKQLTKLLFGYEQEISRVILAGVLDFYRGRFGKIFN